MPFSYRKKYFYLIKRLYGTGLVVGESAESSLRALEEISKSIDISTERREEQIKKAKFSRDLVKLIDSLRALWDKGAQFLYLAPQSEIIKKKMKCICQGQDNLLAFEDMPISSDINHATEFGQLVKFLKTINQ